MINKQLNILSVTVHNEIIVNRMQECPSNNKMFLYVSFLYVFPFANYDKYWKNVSDTHILFCSVHCLVTTCPSDNIIHLEGNQESGYVYLTSFNVQMEHCTSWHYSWAQTWVWIRLPLQEYFSWKNIHTYIPESHSLWLAGVTDFYVSCSFPHSKGQAWKVTYLTELKTCKQNLFFKPVRKESILPRHVGHLDCYSGDCNSFSWMWLCFQKLLSHWCLQWHMVCLV